MAKNGSYRDEPAPAPAATPNTANLANFEWFYTNVIQKHPEWFDTSISKEQWRAWEPFRDKTVNGPEPYKYESVDASGNSIGGLTNKPVDCPQGTTKFGDNQCLPTGHPKLNAGQPSAGPTATPAPTGPVTSGTPGQIDYTGNPLTDMLIYQFNSRRSLANSYNPNIFGFAGGRDPVANQRDALGQPTNLPDITGRLLSGGGLWWAPAGTDLSANPPAATPAPAQAPASTPPPYYAPPEPEPAATQPGITSPPPYVPPQNIDQPLMPTEPDEAGISPLQKMLRGKRRSGAFGDPFLGSY